LWRLPLGAPEKLQRVGAGENGVHPSVARQGQRLAFTDQFTDSNIWRIETSKSGREGTHSPPVKLIASTRADHSPKYSPDGSRIVFNSDRSGREEIWRCDSNGANLVQLTHFGGKGAGTPRWSPDGRQIAFDSRMFGAGDIFVMDAEGGAPRRLTTEPSHDVMPSWSRDSRWIYFCSDRTKRYEVWKAPAEGGPAKQVTWQGGFEAFESTDGKCLYYTKGRFGGIWRVTLKEGEPIGEETMVPGLRDSGHFRYWVPTKEGVFFVPEEHTSVYAIKFLEFSTGQVAPIFTLEREPVFGPPGLDVSPDGRWILYTQVDQKISNITLVEGFR
jgi:Tol biopolymer transport system component